VYRLFSVRKIFAWSTLCIFFFRVIVAIKTASAFLNRTSRLVSVVEKPRVFCEVGTIRIREMRQFMAIFPH
jgi:hypothetical protein